MRPTIRALALRAPLWWGVALVLPVPAVGAQEARFEERVEVRRMLLEVRVLDPAGDPLLGLSADDFRVRIGGRTVDVEAVDWLGTRGRERSGGAAELPPHSHDPATPPVRTVVLFFQRDLHPSRVGGTFRMLREARRFIDRLEPGDLAAVVSYGPGLHLQADLTTDREELRAALLRVHPFREPERRRQRSGPSLAPVLERLPPREVANVEQALGAVARGLEGLPGAKSLLFFGWGMGELKAGVVTPRPGFGELHAALKRGRIGFFSLDVTEADYHTLEVLLQSLSRATGGLYQRLHHQPARLAMEVVAAALAGHYQLSVGVPDLPQGVYPLSVRLEGRPGTVLHQDYAEVRLGGAASPP